MGPRHKGPVWNTIPPPAPLPERKQPEVRIHHGRREEVGGKGRREEWSIPWRVTCYLKERGNNRSECFQAVQFHDTDNAFHLGQRDKEGGRIAADTTYHLLLQALAFAV